MTREGVRTGLRWLLAAAFLAAGYFHLARPGPFLEITPHWVPFPGFVIAATGICEVAGAVGLLLPRTRRIAGAMLALYTVCVFPANIDHALFHTAFGIGGLGWWYHGPRLAFQPVIVWWCLFAGRVVDWPWRAPSPSRGSAALSLSPTGEREGGA